MGNKDFNTFMDSYIDDIRTINPKSSTSGSKSKKNNKKNNNEFEEVPSGVNSDSVYIIKKPKTWWMDLLEKVTGTDEEDFEERKKEEKKVSVEDEQQFEQELDEIKHEEEKKGFLARLFGFFQSDVNEAYEDIDDEQKVEEAPYVSETHTEVINNSEVVEKVSFWGKICGFFGIGAVENYDEDTEIGAAKPIEDKSMEKMIEMKEDMREIAVVATATFKKLPKEQFKMFKESADFKKFKEILKKHNLIKVKEES